jgi:hypothetical protein
LYRGHYITLITIFNYPQVPSANPVSIIIIVAVKTVNIIMLLTCTLIIVIHENKNKKSVDLITRIGTTFY